MSRAEKIRGKVFGSGDKAAAADDAPMSRSTSDVPLTITIPKPAPNQPAPPPKTKQDKYDKSESSPRPVPNSQPRDDKCFRERLIQQLGQDYNGAERYRLLQDAKKEIHWKRWGPYVSDRQWVCLCPTSLLVLRGPPSLYASPTGSSSMHSDDKNIARLEGYWATSAIFAISRPLYAA